MNIWKNLEAIELKSCYILNIQKEKNIELINKKTNIETEKTYIIKKNIVSHTKKR